MTDRKLERPRLWLPRPARDAPPRLAANFTEEPFGIRLFKA